MKPLILLSIFMIFFYSCNKSCKGCYRIEEVNGSTSEFYQGEFCGDEVKAKEKETPNCAQGTCYYECK